jgi:hypothetical protein
MMYLCDNFCNKTSVGELLSSALSDQRSSVVSWLKRVVQSTETKISRPICLLAPVTLLLLLVVCSSSASDSCTDFTVSHFGPQTIDNQWYCAGACKSAGFPKGHFIENGDGGFKCNCSEGADGNDAQTLCEGTTPGISDKQDASAPGEENASVEEDASGERGSMAAAKTTSKDANKENNSFLFLVSGYLMFCIFDTH